MIDTIHHELLQLWDDPHARHTLLSHAPYVLGALGVLPILGIVLSGFRSPTLKIFTLVWFLLAAGGAYFAEESGRAAAESLLGREPPLSEIETAALRRHLMHGTNAWIWLMVPTAMVIFTLPRSQKIHIPAGVLGVISALAVGVWIALAGHSGDRLTKVYGLGVPPRGAPATGYEQEKLPPPPPQQAPGDPPPGHPAPNTPQAPQEGAPPAGDPPATAPPATDPPADPPAPEMKMGPPPPSDGGGGSAA